MSQTTWRVLPPEEWKRLKGTEADGLYQIMQKDDERDDGDFVVVERDGQIVGCWALLRTVHAECVWISPEQRGNPAVARRLMAAMQTQAREMGAGVVFTGAKLLDTDMQVMLERMGAKNLSEEYCHYRLPIPRE